MMIGLHRLFQISIGLLALVVPTQGYTSRMEDRGYNSDPYARDKPRENKDDLKRYGVDLSRVEGRAYNGGPAEHNVFGMDCMLNEAGAFGTSVGNPTLIDFAYQLETVPDTSRGADTLDVIVGSLEKAYLDKILPLLFDCRTRRLVRRKLDIVGATTNPPDEIFPDVTCVAYDSKNDCQQIEGRMYVYTDKSTFKLEKQVLNELERSMDSGEFNKGVHPRIANVTFIDLGTSGLQTGPQTTGSTDPERRLRAPYFAIIAVAGVMLITAGVVWRRRKSNAEDESALTGDTSTLAQDNTSARPSADKPNGDTTVLETTMDFSTVEEE